MEPVPLCGCGKSRRVCRGTVAALTCVAFWGARDFVPHDRSAAWAALLNGCRATEPTCRLVTARVVAMGAQRRSLPLVAVSTPDWRPFGDMVGSSPKMLCWSLLACSSLAAPASPPFPVSQSRGPEGVSHGWLLGRSRAELGSSVSTCSHALAV